MRTKQSSTSLRNMSEEDLQFILVNQPGPTFGGMRQELKRGYAAIQKLAEDKIPTKANRDSIRFLADAYSGYNELWVPYREKNYKRCLSVLKKDITELGRRLNSARMKWIIGSGVKSELRRRGLRDL